MAATVGTVASPIATKLVTDTDADATEEAHASGASGSIYMVEIDNTDNVVATYIKVLDATSGTPATSAADFIFVAPAKTKVSYVCSTGNAFSQGITFWGTSTLDNSPDGSSSVSQVGPGNDVKTRFLTT